MKLIFPWNNSIFHLRQKENVNNFDIPSDLNVYFRTNIETLTESKNEIQPLSQRKEYFGSKWDLDKLKAD